jgi:hypothetical protein
MYEGANKVEVCEVGNLAPGQTYRTPDGLTCMVLVPVPGKFQVVDALGCVSEVPTTTKLGRDRKGRLYASRYLNPPLPVA